MEGKMEGKTRKVKRLAFFTAASMAALFLFVGQPHKVFAQGSPQVASNGVGDLLVFSYWTTQGRDTLIAITNAFGGQATRFVHVRVREGVFSADVRNFTICLSPGDVWTAAITAVSATSSNLTVGNGGSCDAAVSGAGFTPPPAVGVAVPLAAALGYIEAYTMEVVVGGGDDVLWGVATPVNTSDGFSSSLNATAFTNFNGLSESNTVAGNSAISQALAREGGVDKEILLARYVSGGLADAASQIVLSFPTGNQPGAADPVSAFFFDEDENINFSPRRITLSWEVNTCTIAPGADGISEITCSDGSGFDVLGTSGSFTEGWARIINNTIGNENDGIDTPPATRFPVIGTVFSSFVSGSTLFDQSFTLQWAAVGGAGGIGGVGCIPVGGVISPLCASYNIPSTFAPWYRPGGTSGTLLGLITPGDGSSGALIRTGTTGP